MSRTWIVGAFFATLAAIFNATVGVMSVSLFNNGLAPQSVAFLKCIIALVMLLLYVISFKRKELKNKILTKWKPISICAFFGFFILYTFETKAYDTLNVAVVVFILFGSSMITTFILSCLLDRRMIKFRELVSIVLSITGLSLIFSYDLGDESFNGLVNATFSGFGYGVFLVLSKRYQIGSSITTLTSLMMFGTFYLFIYWLIFPSEISLGSIAESSFYLLALAILPTIGGFYCTIKSLSLIKSESVQLIELSEPVFAIAFSFLFLSQIMTFNQAVGGVVIVISILIHEMEFGIFKRKIYKALG
ncbi:DMT family transporter [Vibrio navarrensis]|uniref:EamA domain-containing protein n=1 Tax=Vibrio navarrensis TaxID=29495 RepID=A0A099LMD0_9VIBR|nr:DMT family transporter [Vibrio navarrensis]EKO3572981.1 DMT family transporter [Vibrio metschnikovii]KGK09328.1 hypothetical protein EA26_19215 [Vibrio navarrensis]MBE4616976.1 hypothetical protein [Vibrio navarrensis]QOD70442.1 DMT family transporter [Vibrio navarrensis]